MKVEMNADFFFVLFILSGKSLLNYFLVEGSSPPGKNFPCISMDMLQLLGRLVEVLQLGSQNGKPCLQTWVPNLLLMLKNLLWTVIIVNKRSGKVRTHEGYSS